MDDTYFTRLRKSDPLLSPPSSTNSGKIHVYKTAGLHDEKASKNRTLFAPPDEINIEVFISRTSTSNQLFYIQLFSVHQSQMNKSVQPWCLNLIKYNRNDIYIQGSIMKMLYTLGHNVARTVCLFENVCAPKSVECAFLKLYVPQIS